MWQPRLQPSALQSWQALGAHLVASKKQPQKRLQGSPCKLHHSGSKMVLANGSKGFITHVGDIIRNKRLWMGLICASPSHLDHKLQVEETLETISDNPSRWRRKEWHTWVTQLVIRVWVEVRTSFSTRPQDPRVFPWISVLTCQMLSLRGPCHLSTFTTIYYNAHQNPLH